MASAGINCCSTVSQHKCMLRFPMFQRTRKPAFAIAFVIARNSFKCIQIVWFLKQSSGIIWKSFWEILSGMRNCLAKQSSRIVKLDRIVKQGRIVKSVLKAIHAEPVVPNLLLRGTFPKSILRNFLAGKFVPSFSVWVGQSCQGLNSCLPEWVFKERESVVNTCLSVVYSVLYYAL